MLFEVGDQCLTERNALNEKAVERVVLESEVGTCAVYQRVGMQIARSADVPAPYTVPVTRKVDSSSRRKKPRRFFGAAAGGTAGSAVA